MKTFISRGLAMTVIGTALLSRASPIGFHLNALIQSNSLESAKSLETNSPNVHSNFEHAVDDAQLSDSNSLTRRTPVDRVPIGPFDYSTPLKFIKSLEARRTIARHEEMEQWWPIRIVDLETKVDSLSASGYPPWLETECSKQMDDEIFRRTLFSNKEDDRDDSFLITKHKADIERVRGKLWNFEKRGPGPKHGDSSTHNSSPTNDQVITSRDKARRSRIDEWNTGEQVKSLKERMKKLPTSGFPTWLVDMYNKEISHTLELIKLFEEEEQKYLPKENVYLTRLGKHKTDIDQVNEALKRMCHQNAVGHFEHLMPMIQADGGGGGGWRKHIESLIHQINVLHAHNLTGQLDLELEAAFDVGEEMWSPPLVRTSEEQKMALRDFRGFVRGFQELEVGHGQGVDTSHGANRMTEVD